MRLGVTVFSMTNAANSGQPWRPFVLHEVFVEAKVADAIANKS
jgi:hypothetical protein